MSISKTVVKLAAAAFVVAGLTVGTAVAQPSSPTDQSGKMTASYTVDTKAKMTVDPKNATSEELLNKDVTAALTVATGVNPGTLGTIKVATNSTGWDIWMKTENGGRLIDKAKATTKPGICPPANADPFDPTKCAVTVPDVVTGGEYLTYAPNTATTAGADEAGLIAAAAGVPDTVQLQVAVGIARLGTTISPNAPAGNLYALGGPSVGAPTYVTPQLVGYTALKTSTTTELKFSQLLGGTSTYATAARVLTPPIGTVSNRSWNDIASNGFGAPTYTDQITNLGSDEEYFFIDVGFVAAHKTKLAKNIGGVYSETFLFDLVAEF